METPAARYLITRARRKKSVLSFLQRGDVLRGLQSGMLLEETGEVLGIFEAEGVGGLSGGETTYATRRQNSWVTGRVRRRNISR